MKWPGRQISLAGDGWQAGVLPGAGGQLTSLDFEGLEVLRKAPPGSSDPLLAACFPLVPYANRIAGGRFPLAAAMVQMPSNFPPELSSVHGLGWQEKWDAAPHAEFECTLDHCHPGLGPAPWRTELTTWPWAYQAQQRVRLGPQGCSITLGVTNWSNRLMPAGLGLHPYFRRRPGTRLCFSASGVMEVDAALIPTGTIAPPDSFGDFAKGATLPSVTIDHSFTGWGGTAEIEDHLGSITLSANGAPHLHVFAPGDGSVLCLEPVNHLPDALNRQPVDMPCLSPGNTTSLTMRINASLRR